MIFFIIFLVLLFIRIANNIRRRNMNQHEQINDWVSNLHHSGPLLSREDLLKRNIYVVIDKINERGWSPEKRRRAMLIVKKDMETFIRVIKDSQEVRVMKKNLQNANEFLYYLNKELEGLDKKEGPYFCTLCGQEIKKFKGERICYECNEITSMEPASLNPPDRRLPG